MHCGGSSSLETHWLHYCITDIVTSAQLDPVEFITMTIARTRHSRAAKAKNPYSTKKPLVRKAKKARGRKQSKPQKTKPMLLSALEDQPALRLEDQVVYPRKVAALNGQKTHVAADPEAIAAKAVEAHRAKAFQDELKALVPIAPKGFPDHATAVTASVVGLSYHM